MISAVPQGSLARRPNAPKVPGLGPGQDAFQNIQQAAAGVRFGSIITAKIQGQTDGSQSAQQMSDALKLLASMAQMQSNGDPTAAALMQGLNISSQSNLVNVSISLPSDQFIKLVQPKKVAPIERRQVRK